MFNQDAAIKAPLPIALPLNVENPTQGINIEKLQTNQHQSIKNAINYSLNNCSSKSNSEQAIPSQNSVCLEQTGYHNQGPSQVSSTIALAHPPPCDSSDQKSNKEPFNVQSKCPTSSLSVDTNAACDSQLAINMAITARQPGTVASSITTTLPAYSSLVEQQNVKALPGIHQQNSMSQQMGAGGIQTYPQFNPLNKNFLGGGSLTTPVTPISHHLDMSTIPHPKSNEALQTLAKVAINQEQVDSTVFQGLLPSFSSQKRDNLHNLDHLSSSKFSLSQFRGEKQSASEASQKINLTQVIQSKNPVATNGENWTAALESCGTKLTNLDKVIFSPTQLPTPIDNQHVPSTLGTGNLNLNLYNGQKLASAFSPIVRNAGLDNEANSKGSTLSSGRIGKVPFGNNISWPEGSTLPSQNFCASIQPPHVSEAPTNLQQSSTDQMMPMGNNNALMPQFNPSAAVGSSQHLPLSNQMQLPQSLGFSIRHNEGGAGTIRPNQSQMLLSQPLSGAQTHISPKQFYFGNVQSTSQSQQEFGGSNISLVQREQASSLIPNNGILGKNPEPSLNSQMISESPSMVPHLPKLDQSLFNAAAANFMNLQRFNERAALHQSDVKNLDAKNQGDFQEGCRDELDVMDSMSESGEEEQSSPLQQMPHHTTRNQMGSGKNHSGALKITRIHNRKYIRMPNFTKRQVAILKNWLQRHIDNPYPSHKDKETLCRESGLSRKQIQNWFTNARKRIWLPLVKSEEQKHQQNWRLMQQNGFFNAIPHSAPQGSLPLNQGLIGLGYPQKQVLQPQIPAAGTSCTTNINDSIGNRFQSLIQQQPMSLNANYAEASFHSAKLNNLQSSMNQGFMNNNLSQMQNHPLNQSGFTLQKFNDQQKFPDRVDNHQLAPVNQSNSNFGCGTSGLPLNSPLDRPLTLQSHFANPLHHGGGLLGGAQGPIPKNPLHGLQNPGSMFPGSNFKTLSIGSMNTPNLGGLTKNVTPHGLLPSHYQINGNNSIPFHNMLPQ